MKKMPKLKSVIVEGLEGQDLQEVDWGRVKKFGQGAAMAGAVAAGAAGVQQAHQWLTKPLTSQEMQQMAQSQIEYMAYPPATPADTAIFNSFPRSVQDAIKKRAAAEKKGR